MIYFHTKDLSVGYNGHALIHDINIEVEKGKILTLIGPNGAGKSTILKSITHHLAKICGQVYIDRQEIYAWSARELAKQVAVVLTDRIHPELMTCEEVVAMGRYPYTNALGKLTPRDKEIVVQAMERVHALDLAQRDFTTLSDGQRQRIMLARALCQEPEVLILDEPTAGLDPKGRDEILAAIHKLHEERGITVILVSHSMEDVARLVDRIIVMHKGKVAMTGTPREIFSHPMELEQMGLAAPQVSYVFAKLKEKGYDVPTDIYTVEEARDALLKLVKQVKA